MDLTLTLHEHFESEMVLHGKSKEWLKYHMIMFLTANNAKKENPDKLMLLWSQFSWDEKRKKI